MLKLTLIALFCATSFAFPPDHIDKVVNDYAEGIENLKRTARDIKFIDSDGDVIKIIKSEPLFVKGKVIYLDRSEIVRISPPPPKIIKISPPKYIEIASIEIDDENYSDEVVVDDPNEDIYVLDSGKLCKITIIKK